MFEFWRIGDTGIILGRCPSDEGDIRKAIKGGSVAVLNTETPKKQI